VHDGLPCQRRLPPWTILWANFCAIILVTSVAQELLKRRKRLELQYGWRGVLCQASPAAQFPSVYTCGWSGQEGRGMAEGIHCSAFWLYTAAC